MNPLPLALLRFLLCDDEVEAGDIVRENPQLLSSATQALMKEMAAVAHLSEDEPRVRVLEKRQRLLEHFRTAGIDTVAGEHGGKTQTKVTAHGEATCCGCWRKFGLSRMRARCRAALTSVGAPWRLPRKTGMNGYGPSFRLSWGLVLHEVGLGTPP